MKIISDFDDVLFNNKHFRKIIFICLTQTGNSLEVAEAFYYKMRATGEPFSLKDFIFKFTKQKALTEELYERIMRHCGGLVREEVLNEIRTIGEKNVYIVSSGDEEFQRDKIERTFGDMFSNVSVVPFGKEEEVLRICRKFPNEDVIFIDDKAEYFDEIEKEKHPNLKVLLFGEDGLEALKDEMRRSRNRESKRSRIMIKSKIAQN